MGGETVSLILLLLIDTTLMSLLGTVFLVHVITRNDSITMSNWLSCYNRDSDHSLPGLPGYNEQQPIQAS